MSFKDLSTLVCNALPSLAVTQASDVVVVTMIMKTL